MGVASILACFLIGSTACIALQPKGEPVVVIDPAAGVPGTKVKITGSGFKAGEEIDIVLLLGPGQRIGLGTAKMEVITADGKGAFGVPSAIPKMAKPGKYDVEVEGSKGSFAKTQLDVVKKKK